jgi:alkylated DNA repair dioxygenase AlkB
MLLFDLPPTLPPGFTYTPDFITLEEEQDLIQHIQVTELKAFQFHGYEGKRRTANYGYDWSFEKRTLSKGRPIPEHFHWLIERVAGQVDLPQERTVQLLLIEYPPGAVINWHRDAPPFDMIMGISLQGDRTFRLRPHDKGKQGRGSIISLPVAPRSLYTMHGEARSEWEHATLPVEEVRYSITVRTLK